jgi:hypothetical protein
VPVFVDPNTGERYDNVPEDDVERAEREFGLVTPEQYAAQKAYDDKGVIGKAGDIATAGLQGVARASMAPGMALQYALTGDKQALESPRHPDSAFEESVFSPEAMLRKERHGLTAGVGETVPSMLAAGVTGGATLGPLASAGLLVGESALQGLSQEAVDSVTQKRDFSGKAALMSGGVDLALSALTFGLARGFSKAAPSPNLPGERNLIAEIDPGEVPSPAGGAGRRRQARSAGAAAAANAPYRAPTAAEAIDDAAEPFTEDVWEAAVKSIDDEGLDSQARFLADNQEPLTRLAATNVADSFDDARRIVKDDISLKVKAEDARTYSRDWSPEQQAAQKQWSKEISAEAESLLERIDADRAAAAEVRAGAPMRFRKEGVEAIDAGGVDAAIQKTLRSGVDKVRRSFGADQAVAIDNFKREIGKLDSVISKSQSLDQGAKASRKELVTGFYEKLRGGLEDEAKYGQFAALQRTTNEAQTRLIEPLSRIEQRFSERLGDSWGETGQAAINRRTKTGAVASFMRASPEDQIETLADLSEAINGLEDLGAAREAFGAARLEQLPRLRKNLQEMKQDFNLARTLQVASRRAKEYQPGLGERIAEGALGVASSKVPVVGNVVRGEGQRLLEGLRGAPQMPAANSALGQALQSRLKAYSRNSYLQDAGYSRLLPQWLQGSLRGHGGQVAGVGGVIGAGALLAPGEAGAAEMLPEQRQARDALEAQLQGQPPEVIERQVRTAEAFARIGQQVDRRVKGAVETLFRTATDPETPAYRSPQARALDQRAAELGVPRHLARFMGKADDPTEAFRGKAKLITELARDPAKLSRHMAENLGELPRDQPEIFAGMVAQTMAAVSYLYDKMPGNAGRSVLDPKGYPPTFEEISEWAAHWTGAFHPLDSLDDLASNELQPEQMEAVQGLWLEGYEMFQTAAMSHIHQLSRKKGGVPMDALEQIDAALGLDGAGEPLLSKGMADLLRQAEAQDQEQRQAEGQRQAPPMQSQSPQRLASSALGSLHGEP